MRPTLTIVTAWKDHVELWPAYERAVSFRRPDDELLIVDNGSQPALEFAHIHLVHNEGFHFANNLGLHQAKTDAVLFLNNDIESTDDGWLETIRRSIQPGVIVGAVLRSDDHTRVDGTLEPYLDGWCVAGMRDDLLQIGGWDETLEEPAYFGDNLLSLRARQHDIKLLAVTVGLHHIGNGTSRDLNWVDVTMVTERNRRVYEQAVREARQQTQARVQTARR